MRHYLLAFTLLTSAANAADFSCKTFLAKLPDKKSLLSALDKAEAETWTAIKPQVVKELEAFRKLDKKAKATYLQSAGKEVAAAIQATTSYKNIAFHYNLHGGKREEYLQAGGIVAHMGDLQVSYSGAPTDYSKKVYFYEVNYGIDNLLGEKIPHIPFPRFRMGTIISIFNLDDATLSRYRAENKISNAPLAYDFDEQKFKGSSDFFGVPLSAFVVPPARIFLKTKKLLGVSRLSWEDETLATLRFLQAYIAHYYK